MPVQIVGVPVLRMQGIGRHDDTGEIDAIQQGGEGGNLEPLRGGERLCKDPRCFNLGFWLMSCPARAMAWVGRPG
ncbi:hypothetical protein, partial [Specibacter cremeus]|uniref:hypothetical protein n=1 Tax=Specibacter cremeus TaxID=1629051 RepID=UPI00197BEF97